MRWFSLASFSLALALAGCGADMQNLSETSPQDARDKRVAKNEAVESARYSNSEPRMSGGATPRPTSARMDEKAVLASTSSRATSPVGGPAAPAGLVPGAQPQKDALVGDVVESRVEAKEELPPAETAVPQTEAYESPADNAFLPISDANRLSTFSIDVDTASYANVRRFLQGGSLPPRDAVRIEELLNYFPYSDPSPQGDVPFSVNIEAAECPWDGSHRLVRIGLKGKDVPREQRAVSNLVFLIDVSGSMQDPNKLPLVKTGLRMLIEQLGENDRVSIVVYAGAAGTVLEPTTGDKKREILTAIENLQAGGSTNGGQGIELAYRLAREHLVPKGVNRVILCTDGDFNVGITDRSSLVNYVQDQAKSGVFLTVLGFGMGNLKDAMLEQIADKGNGNYGYIDSQKETHKLLVEQLQGTLVTIAKDVKIQVEFNPARVQSYRLIGYENRILAHQDFDDDRKDAGEIGSGHSVTALYEIVPAMETPVGREAAGTDAALFTLRLRYKKPDGDKSELLEFPALDRGMKVGQASQDFRWAASVAAFGMILRESPYKGNATLPAVIEMADAARGEDKSGYRTEFVDLARRAAELRKPMTAGR